jgi:cbb3-type cytochrome oxidase maturation protein
MDVVYGLIPMMLFFGFLVVLVFIWMAKKGHFDDLDGAAHSIFMDDDDESGPSRQVAEQKKPEFDEFGPSQTSEAEEETERDEPSPSDQKKS